MIDGFVLRFTSKELATHLKERASYHRRRAKEKADQLPKLKEAMDHIKSSGSASSMGRGSSVDSRLGAHHTDDPVGDMEEAINAHRHKARIFDFYAEHLIEEDYYLREGDLAKLEFFKS